MRHEYAVHAGVYEDTWHDYETHKRRKIWRADVRGKRKEGVALSPSPLPRGEGAKGAQTAGFGVALSPTLSHRERERRRRAG